MVMGELSRNVAFLRSHSELSHGIFDTIRIPWLNVCVWDIRVSQDRTYMLYHIVLKL